jgi:hypothetical protein
MLKKQAKGSKRITVGEDKAYDTSDHIGLIAGVLLSHALSGELKAVSIVNAALRRMNVTPHVAQNDSLAKGCKV